MADWGHLAENVARIADMLWFWLSSEYASWTADPDELDAERRRRKRDGYRPPPEPLVEPVASRPPSLHEQLVEDYAQNAIAAQNPTVEIADRWLTDDEFDRVMGLDL